MKSHKLTDTVVLAKGITMILISIIHTIAIYFEYQDAMENIPEYWAVSHAVWFGLTGVFFLFIGIIDLLSYSGLKRGAKYAWRTAFASSIFPAVCGPIGTYIFRNDQPTLVFPMIIMFLGIIGTIVLAINYREFKK